MHFVFLFEIHFDVFVFCFSNKKYKIHFDVGYMMYFINEQAPRQCRRTDDDSSSKWTVRRVIREAIAFTSKQY